MQTAPSSSTITSAGDTTIAVVTGKPQRADRAPQRTPSTPQRPSGGGATELVHDAKDLLSSLRRYSELMTAPGVLSEDYRHLAQELQVLSDRSAAMLGRLLTLNTTQELPTSPDLDLEAMVLPVAVLDLLGLLSRIAGRAVTFFCSPSAYAPVSVSRSAFERILINLVKNASESNTSGSVELTLVGMRDPAQEAMLLVLTVYQRVRVSPSARPREVTAGGPSDAGNLRHRIGFQVVQELAESSGGKVEIESEREGAMSVSVTWPAMRPRVARHKSEPPASHRGLSEFELAKGAVSLLAGGGAC